MKAFIAAFSFIIISAVLLFFVITKNVKEESLPIKSCDLISETSANFILGTGVSKSGYLYYVYMKNGEGYQLSTFDSRWTTIVETDSVEPYVHGVFDFSDGVVRVLAQKPYVIYVPVGTTKESFSLNP